MSSHAARRPPVGLARRGWRRALLVAVVAPAVVLAGCGSDGDEDPPSTERSTAELPPVIVDIGSLEGTTVEVRDGGAIVITGDDETFADWTATIADPAVVAFVPGRDDGSARFDPGLEATAVGSTEVTLTNAVTGTTVDFRVDVTPDGAN